MIARCLRPVGPYRLRLMVRSGVWQAPLVEGRAARAWQRPDGSVEIRASDEAGIDEARFMLALDDDTAPFHDRFAHDPLLGNAARALVGYRPLRLATVTHAVVRAVCGQLIEAKRAYAIERAIARAAHSPVLTRAAMAQFGPTGLRRLGLAQSRATALLRLLQTVDVERLRDHPTSVVLRRLQSAPGFGPWSVGVIALEGLGRYDHGLVGDLGLVKLHTALSGRVVEPHETAALLAPYGEWQGLAGEILMRGAARGLIAGADYDVARLARRKARGAA